MPADLTVGQFVYVIRKRIKVSPEKAIFMFVKNVLPPTGKVAGLWPHHCTLCCVLHVLTSCVLAAAFMSDVYADHKDDDGFLYITYSGENTFGSC